MLGSHTSKLFTIFAILAVSIFGIGTRVSVAQDDPAVDAPTEYTVNMTEFQFLVDGQTEGTPLQFEVGKTYTLHFINAGLKTHEVLIGQGAIVVGEGMHHDFTTAMLDDVEVSITGMMNDAEFTIGATGLAEFEIQPTQEISITFTVPEEKMGEWEVGCFVFLTDDATMEKPVASHYDVGMKLTLNVVAAAK